MNSVLEVLFILTIDKTSMYLEGIDKKSTQKIKIIIIYHVFVGEDVYTGFWKGNLRERDHLEDPGVDGRIILRWIFRKWYGGHGLD
jgi:hypothetical protein